MQKLEGFQNYGDYASSICLHACRYCDGVRGDILSLRACLPQRAGWMHKGDKLRLPVQLEM